MKVLVRFIISFLLILPFFNFSSSITLRRCQKIKNSYQQEVTVTLKLIQVYVVDKDGNSVTELKQTDFILYDNGKLKTITEFEKHLLALPGKKQEEKKSHLEKPNRSAETQTKLPLMSRKFLLFFDFAFNDAQGILKAKRASLHFIDTQLHPDDEVGVISYDTFRGTTLHEYFTTEHQKIREVIENFGIRNATGRAENIRRDDWASFGSGSSIRDLYKNQVKNFSSNLRDLAKALRYIPGRKNIIFYSGGVANSILYGERLPKTRGSGMMRSSLYKGSYGSASLRNLYEGMIKELAASNNSVYPINTSGKGIAHFRDRKEMGDFSLQQLARVSGGEYYDNITSYEKINKKIQSHTSFYYVLGYYIDDKWDDKYHRVKVKVKKKGYKILGQTGYFNPKPFTEYTELEKFFHLVDLALSEKPLLQEALHFPVVTLPFSMKGKPNLVAITKIPGKLLKDIFGDRMEIVILVFDKENNITLIQEKRASAINLARQSSYIYSFCSLSPGDYACQIVIRNLKTGQGAVASSSITIPAGQDAGFKLYPPLLLIPENKALYIKGEEKDKKATDLSLSDIFPFDTTLYAPLVKELDKDTTKITAVIRCFPGGITEPEISLRARLVSSTSREEIPVHLKILDQTQDQNVLIYSLELCLPVLQPGDYLLIISADEHKSRITSRTVTEIKIR